MVGSGSGLFWRHRRTLLKTLKRHLTGFQALGKHIRGICASYFVEIGQDFQMKEVYHPATQYGVYLRLAQLRCIYIFSISKCGSPVESATLPVMIDKLPALLAWKGQNHGWRVNLQLLRSYKNVSEHEHIHRKTRLFALFLPIGRMYMLWFNFFSGSKIFKTSFKISNQFDFF